MKKRMIAAITALIMTASAASCGKSEDKTDSADTATATATAARTTKKESDSSSKEKTTKKTKKKKTETGSEDDSSKEKTTKKTKKTTVEIPEEIDAPEGEFDENNELGWTKAIYDKYVKYGEDPKEFLMSLTLEEFIIVVNSPEKTAREQYNALHGITTTNTAKQTTTAAETAPPETTAATDKGSTVDMTEDVNLKYTYNKFGVTLEDLLAITGYTKEEFFYLWNEKKDTKFRNSVMNQLYGYNRYDSETVEYPVTAGKVDVRLVSAFWDDSGNLHVICSLKSGIQQGIACNLEVPSMEVYNKKGGKIAQKYFGYITEPVENAEAEYVEGLEYNTTVLHEFLFDKSSVSIMYADIRANSGIKINFQLNNSVYNPNADSQMVP